MNFKLLALRINSEFPLKKNLKANLLYRFSSDFIFYDDKNVPLVAMKSFREIIRIEDSSSYPSTLYNLNLKKEKPLAVRISAVLGKNGAGKSSLLEMLYLLVFCLAEQKRYIGHRSFLKQKIVEQPEVQNWRALLKNTELVLSTTDIELYYQVGEEILLIKKTPKQIDQYRLSIDGWVRISYDPHLFFYTICVNYSQYSLNATGNYYWLKPLFHKNDGYRTPIVLNPFRDAGNIDINRELHLAQTRLLTNLSSERFNTNILIDDKKVAAVTFYVRPAKNGIISGIGENSESDVPVSEIYEAQKLQTNVDLVVFFTLLIAFFDKDKKANADRLTKTALTVNEFFSNKKLDFGRQKLADSNGEDFDDEQLSAQIALYIISKVLKICNKYSDFRKFTEPCLDEKGQLRFYVINNAKDLTARLLSDQSHVTLKLKQAINAFINEPLQAGVWRVFQDEENSEYFAYSTTIPFDEVRETTRNTFKSAKYKNKSLSHFIPVAFFSPSIEISDGAGTFPFSQLSSGEQQLVHSVHSVLYHLLNLDSLGRTSDNSVRRTKFSYSNVNLVLDEIELYYHPSYQRDFIRFLLESIEKINLESITGINILFSTHSPFILSDIPHTNVLKLQAGSPAGYGHGEQTFGANIHDMLADSFFLDQSLIGAFAEKTINNCIAHLEQMRLYRAIENLRDNIKFPDGEISEIERLEKQVEALKIRSPFQTYEEARQEELKNEYLHGIINLIGEPVIRFKLLEMYDEVMLDENSEKERARRMILALLKENNMNKEDL